MVNPEDKPYMWDAFLSYSSKNEREARALVRRLSRAGLAVWAYKNQIGPGDRIARINDGLANSRRIVILLSKASIRSKWCEAEVMAKLTDEFRTDTIRVIVVHRGLQSHQIPDLLRGKRYIDLRSVDDVNELIERLRQPASLDEYRATLRRRHVLPHGLGLDHVEVPDLMPVVLREVRVTHDAALRPIRASPSIAWSQWVSDLTSKELGRVVLLLGESGVGKTTLCRWLCWLLAQGGKGGQWLPVYLSLGQWDSTRTTIESALDRELGFGTVDTLLAGSSTRHRLIVFLDGLNEQRPEHITSVLALARRLASSQRALVVLTSRPVASATTMSVATELRMFEIQRWTVTQLQGYFRANGRLELLKHVPSHVQHSLRLPLLASLVVRRALQESPTTNGAAVSDAFEYVLDLFLHDVKTVTKTRAMRVLARPRMVRPCLRALALHMTEQRIVQTTGRMLEQCLPRRSASAFKTVLSHAVNGGLLRSSAALDAETSVTELRTLRISFLHQSFQEYLAAQHLIGQRAIRLPKDVSNDAFWREIPLYLMRALSQSAERQRVFALGFLDGSEPDYLTPARLVNEIADPSLAADVRERVTAGLMTNLEEADVYPSVIEAFRELGADGIRTLHKSVESGHSFRSVYARAEAHVIGRPIEGASEAQWRRVARVIYVLGELGDVEFLGHFAAHIPDIQSVHLSYHLGEMLLTLSKQDDLRHKDKVLLSRACVLLRDSPLADPIVSAQALAASRALGVTVRATHGAPRALAAFLRDRANTANPHFGQEFWRRAHGVEALAEVGDIKTSVATLEALHRIEDSAHYGEDADGSYQHVQSSIVKAISRSCDAHPHRRDMWRPLLESIFRSRRVAENAWACRLLEPLLLRAFGDAKGLAWIARWKESNELGGELLQRTLANVLFLSS